MPSKVEGDFSKYPKEIQDIFPYVCGEVSNLRYNWDVYHDFFMEKREHTELIGKHLGEMFGIFQNLLQDEIFLSVSRLTDKTDRKNKNVSLWAINSVLKHEKDPEFLEKVNKSIERIFSEVSDIRRHRSKRIAHYDHYVIIESTSLPIVKFKKIGEVIEMIESHMNLFHWHYEETTVLYDAIDSTEPFLKVFDSIYKLEELTFKKNGL